MKKIRKIILREFKNSFMQYLALILVVFFGMTAFNALAMSARNFKATLNDYYEEYHFFDYFFDAVNIPESSVDSIRSMAGVASCWPRVNVLAGVNMAQKNNRVLLKMLSLPDEPSKDEQYIEIIDGTYFSDFDNACMINTKFAAENDLKLNDTVEIVIDDEIYLFKINAFVDSPEFIYVAAPDGPDFVNDEDFGIVYVKESYIQSILQSETYNQLLMRMYDKNNTQIIKNIETMLDEYGLISSTARQDHLNYIMVSADAEILELLALIFPIMFLLVSTMIIFSMLSQLIQQHKKSIGILLSLGYPSRMIRFNYSLLSIIIALFAAIPAMAAGYYLSISVCDMFNEVYKLEAINQTFYWNVALTSLVIGFIACFLTGYLATHRIIRMTPAASMRSDSSDRGEQRYTSAEKAKGFRKLWRPSFRWKYMFASLMHNKRRSLLTVLGFSVTIMLFIAAISYNDSTNWLLDQYFDMHQKYDFKITLNNNERINGIHYFNYIEGVELAEPALQVAAQIQYNGGKQDTFLYGLPEFNPFIGLYDNEHLDLKLGQGVAVCTEYADKLGIHVGDKISLKIFGEEEKVFEVRVDSLAKLSTGFSCFMDLENLCEQLHMDDSANVIYLQSDAQLKNEMKEELLKYKNIKFIEEKEKTRDIFSEQMMAIIVAIIGFIVTFASVMGFVVIFNMTILNVTERQNQYAVLKALGVYNSELSSIIFWENIVLGVLSIIPGTLLGLLMSSFITSALSSDMYVMESVVPIEVYFITMTSVLLFIGLAHIFCMKRISKMDLVSYMAERDS
jgi:putative ABC transport system permease protein